MSSGTESWCARGAWKGVTDSDFPVLSRRPNWWAPVVLLGWQQQFGHILRNDSRPLDRDVRDRSSLAVLPLHITRPRLANTDQFVVVRELKCLKGFEHRDRLTSHGIKSEELSG